MCKPGKVRVTMSNSMSATLFSYMSATLSTSMSAGSLICTMELIQPPPPSTCECEESSWDPLLLSSTATGTWQCGWRSPVRASRQLHSQHSSSRPRASTGDKTMLAIHTVPANIFDTLNISSLKLFGPMKFLWRTIISFWTIVWYRIYIAGPKYEFSDTWFNVIVI